MRLMAISRPNKYTDFLDEISQFFLGRGVSAIVVACNTATSVAINKLRKNILSQFLEWSPPLNPPP